MRLTRHGLDAAGVEVVGLGVVVGGGGDDDVIGPGVGLVLVERGAQVQGLVRQEVLDVDVVDGAAPGVDHLHLGRHDVERHHLVVLGQKNGVGKTDVAGAGDGDFHGGVVSLE
jgi:hypothetical protein